MQAIEYQTIGLKISKEVGNKLGEEEIYASLGCVFNWRRDFQRAIEYHKRTLVVSNKVWGKDLEAVSLFNLGVVSEKQGLSSLDYYRSSVTIYNELRAGQQLTEVWKITYRGSQRCASDMKSYGDGIYD